MHGRITLGRGLRLPHLAYANRRRQMIVIMNIHLKLNAVCDYVSGTRSQISTTILSTVLLSKLIQKVQIQ